MTGSAAEACHFGPAERPLFGWLHRSANDRPRTGLVVCNPFGYEAICAHRSLKHFATAAAAKGIPALRFDYDGTGDSAGGDLDSDRLESWIASIRHAVAELRKSTGVDQIVLLGVRLGAFLAALAATQPLDIEALEVAGMIAIAPVIRGRLFLRELKALQIAMKEAPEQPPADGTEEYAGFQLTAATREAIGRIDLEKLPKAPARKILVLDRDDRPKSDAWIASLRTQGAEVQAHALPGYVEMMLDSHEAQIPAAMIEHVERWLESFDAQTDGPRQCAPAHSTRPTPLFASSRNAGAPKVLEEPRIVGARAPMFGIVTRPATDVVPKRAVLLLNSGAVHHVGPNRWYVELARELAARDFLVLRLDLSGIGDSGTYAGMPENIVYSACAVTDVVEAAEFLRTSYRIEELSTLGLCSGAYHSLKSALKVKYKQIFVINPLTFFWQEGMSLEFADFRISTDAMRYKKTAFQASSWLKLFTGKVNVRELAIVLTKRAGTLLGSYVKDLKRALKLPLRDDLGTELLRIQQQATKIHFAFAQTDPGLDLLRTQAGSTVRSMTRRGSLSIEIVEGANHTFTARTSRERLHEIVLRSLAGDR